MTVVLYLWNLKTLIHIQNLEAAETSTQSEVYRLLDAWRYLFESVGQFCPYCCRTAACHVAPCWGFPQKLNAMKSCLHDGFSEETNPKLDLFFFSLVRSGAEVSHKAAFEPYAFGTDFFMHL